MVFIPHKLLCLSCIFVALALSANATTVNATWNTATDAPIIAGSYTATGSTVNFTLNCAPIPGTSLTVVSNTGQLFINGTFDNLPQGQAVSLNYNGSTYQFAANYYGGTGNDLVLVWSYSRPLAWGYNAAGEIGDNSTTDSGIPVAVTAAGTPLAGRTLLALSAGNEHSLALCSDGTLAAWGYNAEGELGNNTTANSSVPVSVTTTGTPLEGRSVAAISSGYGHNLALCTDGTLVSWGYNNHGQLGNNTTANSSVPVAVATAGTPLEGRSVVAISSGRYHSLVLLSDGTLAAWGWNSYGQLGNNTITDSSIPVAVTTTGTPLAGKTVVAIAAGGHHCIALCSDGTIAAWGMSLNGQLGNNSTGNRGPTKLAVAVIKTGTILAGKTVSAVAAGTLHNLALCTDGTLAAWGGNNAGQLGNNSNLDSGLPVAVSRNGVLSGKTVAGLTAGASYSLACCTDGTVTAWGINTNGQLGNNSTTNSLIPVVVNTSSLAAGESFMLVGAGSCANHTLGLVASPVPVPATADTISATSITTTSAVLNGSVNANGGAATVSFDYGLDNTYGTNVAGTPAAVSGSSVTAVGTTLTGLSPATTYHFRASASNGSGTANGADMTFTTLSAYISALGLSSGTLSPSFIPTAFGYHASVDTLVSSVSITATTADNQATVAINGSPVLSGNASSPISLLYGDNTIKIVVTASDRISTQTYSVVVTRAVPASWTVAYSSGTDAPVTTNGFTATGGTVDFVLNYAPMPGTTLMVVNNTGLGFINGTFNNLAHGQEVNLSYNGVTYPFAASYYGGTGNDLVLVWARSRPIAWGYNLNGQLGNNTITSSNVPTVVTTAGTPLAGRTLLALSVGGAHSVALCSDGTLAAWGSNLSGQLGNNQYTDSSIPVAVTTSATPLDSRTVIAASSGDSHTLVLCSDGTLVAWGSNSKGQLGNGTTTVSRVPVAVTTAGTPLEGKVIVAVAAGSFHNLALCSDGTLAAWGYNTNGQLGNNTTTNSSIPVAVTTAGSPLAGKTVVSIAAGEHHNVALCSDGTLVTWGFNWDGELGNNTTTNSSVPVAVTTAGTVLAGKTIVKVASGSFHCLALCSDDTLTAWGSNIYGELGDGTRTNRKTPVAVSTSGALAGKSVIGFSAGNSLSLAQCEDGTALGWGYNGYGELGSGDTNSIISGIATVSSSAFAVGETFMQVASGQSADHALGLAATPVPATSTTLAATSLTATSVVLNGIVNANGGGAAVSFDYGLLSSYGANVAGMPGSVSGGTSTAVSTTLTGLTPGTTYHFRVNGSNGSGTANGADLTFTTLTLQQNWRQTFFGATANSGRTADTADYDGDGIPNLMEYALNFNPTTAGKLPVTTSLNGANFEYTYTRSTASVSAGTSYTVEWSGALPGTWSSSGVTQAVLSDDGTAQQVKATIPTNATQTMFVRLSVTAPP